MRRICRSFLVISCAAGAMFGIAGGAGIAQASTTQASTTTHASLTAAVSPASTRAGLASPLIPQQTEPPGACEPDEEGEVALGPDGYLYQCEYVPGEGYYWLPV